jgi:predicted dehydrogenase
MRELLATVAAPKSLMMTVNAGAIPNDHWLQDPAVGGGRLLGEACHFIDLLRHLTGSAITGFDVTPLNDPSGPPLPDKATIVLRFADGSVGTVHYLANGHKAYPKEKLEIFCAGRILELDNFRRLRGWGWSGFSSMNLWGQDKGQAGCASAFVRAVRNGQPSPIPLDEILEVSRISIDVAARSAARSS